MELKNFYLQINDSNIVTDAIEFPYPSYILFEASYLPPGILGGWFKFENGELVEIPELNPNNIENKIKAAIDEFTMNLLIGGLL